MRHINQAEGISCEYHPFMAGAPLRGPARI
jgi:hypothetical protein